MGLDLWFKEDVVKLLALTYHTMSVTQSASAGVSEDYRRGFEAALQALALGFGIDIGSRNILNG